MKPTLSIYVVCALLVAAGLACSIDVSTAHFKDAGLFYDPDGDSRARTYAPADTFYCVTELRQADDDTVVRAVWTAVEIDGQPAPYEVDETELTTGSGPLTFEATPPEPGWPTGRYQLDLYLDGRKEETLEFSVK